MTNLQQNFPQINAPFVDKQGVINSAWRQFLQALWTRTGSGGGGVITGEFSVVNDQTDNVTAYPVFSLVQTGASVGYIDITKLNFNPSTGIFTAIGFIGNITGNVTGNVTGNLVGNVTGNVTGNVSGSAASFTTSLNGDVIGSQNSTVVQAINSVNLAGLATGLLKNNNGTGAPTIAVAGTDYETPSAAFITALAIATMRL